MHTISNELKNHFLRLFQIACSDENFDMLELKQLYEFAAHRGIDTQQLQRILIDTVFGLSILETLDERIEYLYDLAVIIQADQNVSDDKYMLLRKFAKKFQFADENIEQICDFLLESSRNELTTKKVIGAMNSKNLYEVFGIKVSMLIASAKGDRV
ncbi:hypothetical protein SAMN05421813_105148 [Daejeonella rubra]|uniref:Tellurite resistance protein TerB n=1 Tax=Daejeonella rubra TaxID=990371 RepID=A0A1G9Q700_9SPHI|nr:TerB family tellurite resistance protein [Daejeonella rubra]SDM06808.1 hypothetical protein SAMN05421813_105148 [Daejeonella rubra]